MTEQEFQKELLSAFEEIGYSKDMLLESVSFVGEGGNSYTAKAVLYSDPIRRDAENAVIAIQETEDARNPNHPEEINPFFAIGTPIIVLAEYKKLNQGMISVVGLAEKSKFRIDQDNVIPFSRFKEYVKRNRENFSPRKLEEVKLDPSQFRKFKVDPYLFEGIIKISEKELVQRYNIGLKKVIETYPKDQKALFENSLILLASRILRDKLTVEKKDTWSVNCVSDLIEGAKGINEYFHIPSQYRKKLEPLLEYLPSHFDYSQLGIEALGHFYETAILNKKTKQKFGVYYTPSIIAKTILKRMPIEEIRPENRILLDPTCGSGSFLLEGYKRLTQATYLKVPVDERHKFLINTMYGNDTDGFAATIAKLTLLLFHPPHKNNWKVFIEDAKTENFVKNIITKLGNKRPTIIVGNLPFGFENKNSKAVGRSREGSSIILESSLELLEENGLMGIILPESFVLLDHPKDKLLRHKLLSEFQIIDRWKTPSSWFRDADHPAITLIIRKMKPEFKVFNIIELSGLPDPINKNKNSIDIYYKKIDTKKLPETLVISRQEKLLMKLKQLEYNVNKFYTPFSGFILRNESHFEINLNNLNDNFRVWLDNAENKNQFFDIASLFNKKYIDINDITNLHPVNARRDLRDKLSVKKYQVMLRANRNNPSVFKWSSICFIDVKSEKGIATSSSFYPTFIIEDYRTFEKEYLYALWSVLNSPIASFYLREISLIKWIKISDYRNFPLPDCWDEVDKIKTLASRAKQLLDLKRKYDSDYISNNKDNERKSFKAEQTLRNKILSLVKETDKIIYDMYNFTKSEIQQIEDFFGNEKRPGLEELGEEWKQFKPVKKREKKVPSIDPNELKDFGTSFETIEVNYEKLQVKLIVNGLRDREDGIDVDQEGIWLPITPYMPGWILRPGANGMIYLKTYDSVLIQEFPEYFIKDFSLMKNAYKTIEEIEENVFREAKDQGREVG